MNGRIILPQLRLPRRQGAKSQAGRQAAGPVGTSPPRLLHSEDTQGKRKGGRTRVRWSPGEEERGGRRWRDPGRVAGPGGGGTRAVAGPGGGGTPTVAGPRRWRDLARWRALYLSASRGMRRAKPVQRGGKSVTRVARCPVFPLSSAADENLEQTSDCSRKRRTTAVSSQAPGHVRKVIRHLASVESLSCPESARGLIPAPLRWPLGCMRTLEPRAPRGGLPWWLRR